MFSFEDFLETRFRYDSLSNAFNIYDVKTWFCHIKEQQLFDYTGGLLGLEIFEMGSRFSWEGNGSGLRIGALMGGFCF